MTGELRRPHRLPVPTEEQGLNVALIHDWLTGMRGGEQCLEVLCSLFPQADIHTLFHCKGTVSERIESHAILTSFLQAVPALRSHYRYLLPLFPLAVEGFDLNEYSLVISSSHCVAKGVIPRRDAVHICYCFSPMRYIWDMYPLYFRNPAYKSVPARLASVISHYLRLWDVASSQRVDHFVAISKFVAARIRRYYRRESSVIYPPVNCSRFSISRGRTRDYYLLVSAEAPYKRIDLAIDAFRSLGRPLCIVGNMSSEDSQRCRLLKRKNISPLGWVPQEELEGLYAHCRALIFPGEEDFGMVPVEAQASGRPVIAYGRGGALESVKGLWSHQVKGMGSAEWKAGYTGLFFERPTATGLVEAVEAFESVEGRFDPDTINAWAQQFDTTIFERTFWGFVEHTLRRRSIGPSGETTLS